MRVLVTGASGFLGRAVVAAGANAGHHMIAASRAGVEVTGAAEAQATGDLTDGPSAIDFARADAVVHCAAHVHVLEREDPHQAERANREVNAQLPVTLARAARAAGVRQFVQISSVAALASVTAPGETLSDTSPPSPTTAYGRAKLAADKALAALASDAFAVTSLRPPALYGPGVGAHFARLMRAAKRGIPLPVGAITNRRSFAYVGNVAHAAICAAGIEGRSLQSGSFIVADSLPISTAGLYRKLLALHGHPDRAWRWPAPLISLGARLVLGERAASLTGDAAFDGGRFAQRFDWHPPTDMDEALRLTIEHDEQGVSAA